jgi:hypothetical protein
MRSKCKNAPHLTLKLPNPPFTLKKEKRTMGGIGELDPSFGFACLRNAKSKN